MIGYFGVLHALRRLELSLDEPREGPLQPACRWLNERGKKDWRNKLMKLKNIIYTVHYTIVIYCNIMIYIYIYSSKNLTITGGIYLWFRGCIPDTSCSWCFWILGSSGCWDPCHRPRPCRRSAHAMKAQGSWVMRGWWNVRTSVPTNWWWIRHF